ncbi:MAG: right-handed parallel beta-helix repeat-containing protein [Clostridiales bacterium]|nr:right-handed parallel beta-helix repeat-containing protein [Clostridiales bacterium]
MFNFKFLESRFTCFFVSLVFVTLLLCTQVSVAGELQNMIDIAEPGETVYIKGGTYRESLVIDKDLKLTSKSMDDVIIIPESSPSGYAVEIRNNIKVSIEGIRFQLSGLQEAEPLGGIKAKGSTVKLINCKITGAQKIGVFLHDCTTIIENCHIESSNESGVHAEFGNIKVKKSTFVNNKKCGLYFNALGNGSNIQQPHLEYEVSNSYIQGESVGITIQGDCSGKIFQNQITDNDNSAIFITKGTGKHDIIENNISQSNYGIYLELLKNEKNQTSLIEKNTCSRLVRGMFLKGETAVIDILGNQCLDNDEDGIWIESTGKVKLLNNVCNDNGGQGIYLLYVKKGAIIENNICQRNKKNGIRIECSKTSLKKNKMNNNEFNGISVDCGVIELKENECVGNKGSGIYLYRHIDGQVKNNTLKDNRFYGILRGEFMVVSTIEDNKFSGNLKGNIWQKEKEYGDFCSMLINKKIDELDAIGHELRKNETKDSNGRWIIRNFYDEMSMMWENISDEHPDIIVGILNDWIEQKPDSIIPYVILARVYVQIGWSYRGRDWAYKVKDENWEKFRGKLNEAVAVIHKAEKLKEKDTHLYCVLITVGMGLSDDDLINEGFEKGVAINKYYPPLYFEKAETLLPRWGGKKGELEKFADETLTRTEDKYGSILYARIALFTHSYTYPKFDAFNFSYDKIKQGHEDILKRYPDSKHYINSYCIFACLNNDINKAKELFEKIGQDYSYALWRDQNNLKKHYDWVYSKNMPN